MSMTKITSVTQQPGESPGDYHERLCEAYRVYTLFDPEAPESQQMVNTSFVAQAAPDIRRKLQKLEGFAGMNVTQLIEVTNKVFITGKSQLREAEKRLKKRATLLAAALKETETTKRGKGQSPLSKDQCAYCKEKGHWKNECPNQKGLPKPSQY